MTPEPVAAVCDRCGEDDRVQMETFTRCSVCGPVDLCWVCQAWHLGEMAEEDRWFGAVWDGAGRTRRAAMTTRDWHDIAPADAVDIVLPRDDISGPFNEDGEPCPWPWEPQQLVGAPLGQYHCGYCGAMCVAGVPHLDYGATP